MSSTAALLNSRQTILTNCFAAIYFQGQSVCWYSAWPISRV